MPVYRDDKTNTWRVIYRYTDWTGERKQTSRRGFTAKRESACLGAGADEFLRERPGHDLRRLRGALYNYAHLFPSEQTEMAKAAGIDEKPKAQDQIARGRCDERDPAAGGRDRDR